MKEITLKNNKKNTECTFGLHFCVVFINSREVPDMNWLHKVMGLLLDVIQNSLSETDP